MKADRKKIIAVTMPCFGTSDRTHDNAVKMCESLGVTLREVNIKEAVNIHFRDIDHSSDVHDVTYENAQARERTQVLMDIANGSSRIKYYINGLDFDNHSNYDELINKTIELAVVMRDIFKKYI